MSGLPLNLLKGAALLAIMAGLAGCGGGGGNSGASASMTPAPGSDFDPLAADYGQAFAADYRMASTATPPVPMSGDIVPLTFVAQPYPQF